MDVISSPDLSLRSELDVIHAIVWWLIGNGNLSKRKVADFLSNANPSNVEEIAVQEVSS